MTIEERLVLFLGEAIFAQVELELGVLVLEELLEAQGLHQLVEIIL